MSLKSLIKNKRIATAVSVLLALGIWQAAAFIVGEKILLASPVEVIVRLATIWTEPGFFGAIGFSFSRIVGGFLLGLLVGSLLAVAAGRFEVVDTLLKPLMVTVKTVPVASFIVIALIWLSPARLSVFISFLIVLPVVYSNVLGGIRSIPKNMTVMADVFHMPWHRRFVYIWLPAVRPYLTSACASALGMSWKAGVAAEVIGLPQGSMGEALYDAKIFFNTTDLLAWTVIIVVVSVLFERLFMALLKFGFGRLVRL
ncbi:MAG: ABC transporter permease subunit [Clostridiales bacterium]|nr:ABC transporter permease subunit [Clostridiales bacterium]HOA85294.1 ABC transporter permease subunit [Bacillota bacterium]